MGHWGSTHACGCIACRENRGAPRFAATQALPIVEEHGFQGFSNVDPHEARLGAGAARPGG